MEAISLKLDTSFLKKIEQTMKQFNYSTKTEFIREAIRDKIDELDKKRRLKMLDRLYGSSKKKTTDKQRDRAGEKAFLELEREMGLK